MPSPPLSNAQESRRPSSLAPPPVGRTSLSACVAKVEVSGQPVAADPVTLSRGLVGLFGGNVADYRIAVLRPSSWAVFFPSWVTRESAIGRSPLIFEDTLFSFRDWVEAGEEARGRLLHKAWIKLVDWPILAWKEEDVKAAISSFGELWEVDDCSTDLRDVSHYRIRIRCQDVALIPEVLLLTVDDRRFRVRVTVESWEEAVPILLGENLDHHLGLDTIEEQEDFIRYSGFNSVPALDPQLLPQISAGSEPERGLRARLIRDPPPSPSPVLSETDFPPLLPPASTTSAGTEIVSTSPPAPRGPAIACTSCGSAGSSRARSSATDEESNLPCASRLGGVSGARPEC